MSRLDGGRGKRTEAEVAAFLSAALETTVRPVVQGGAKDRGDLEGLPDFAVQVKDHERQNFSEWLDDVDDQRREAAELFGVVIARRRGRPLGQAYAVLTLDTFVRILALLELEQSLNRA